VPTLVLAGEEDAKFTVLGQRLAEAIPHAEFCSIPGAGHSVHLEEPELTAQEVKRFVERLFG
jgi:pimeloyl-ACP methyl ester carboxylesterase